MDDDDVRDLGTYNNIYFKTASAAGSGLILGNITGALVASWTDIPTVERNHVAPALRKTAQIMGRYGVTFAAIGGVFAAVEAATESFRGKKDFWNGAMGGAAAGAVIGLRSHSLSSGIAASVAMAAMAVMVDVSGGKVVIPTDREYLSYSTVAATSKD